MWGSIAAATLALATPVFAQNSQRGRHRSRNRRPTPFFHAYLPDPSYAHRSFAPQDDRPVRRIRFILQPTLGFPALAGCGKNLTVWIVAPDLTSDPSALRPRSWHVSLKTDWSGGAKLRPKVVSLARDQDILRIQARLAPDSPSDVYHLVVRGPGGLKDSQPRAVRIFCPIPKRFTIALLSDHQLWDPSWKVSSGLRAAKGWPDWGQADDNKRITLQEFHELELIDPAFVLYPGDLLFGLDYRKEYVSMYEWWKNRRLATFMVPGNHDGYARYTVRLRGSLPQMARALLRCRKDWPKTRSWHKIFAYLSCLYGDIKEVLFSRLVHDGLVSFAKTFGPPFYAFDVGRYHFVALNTYDGTNRRRHSLSLWVPFKGLKLGAPAVDNYGGYLSEKQLAWLQRDLSRASARGQTIVVFGHQDPRGNLDGERYHRDQPFPTSPLGLDGFDEWDYDAKWDSNPNDTRGRETPWHNSGVRLLRLLLRYASYYISGHVHADETTIYHPGDLVIPGMTTKRTIAFLRVTTASAGVRNQGYWGYRLLQADDKGHIDVSPYDRARGLDSVPAGRFWLTSTGSKNQPEWTLHSALPRPLPITLRARLTFSPKQGYWFVSKATGRRPHKLHLASVAPDQEGPLATYRVALTAPALRDGGSKERVVSIQARAARGNKPPRILVRLASSFQIKNRSLESMRLDKTTQVHNGQTIDVPVGRRVVVDASASYDPEHKPLLAAFLRVDRLCPAKAGSSRQAGADKAKSVPQKGVASRGDKNEKHKDDKAALVPCGTLLNRRGTQAAFVADRLGVFRVRISAYDSAGARSDMTFYLRSKAADVAAPRPGCGCCGLPTTPVMGLGGLLSLIALSLALAGLLLFFRRRHPGS